MEKVYPHGANTKAIADEFGISEDNLIDYSSNINPLGMPNCARQAAAAALETAALRYPDAQYTLLRQALAAVYAVDEQQILPGNGGAELIPAVVEALPIKRVVICEPAFGEYAQAAAIHGLACELLAPAPDFSYDLLAASHMLCAGDLLFLCSPNNPTGIITLPEKLEEIVATAQIRGAWCLVDESFLEFIEGHEAMTMLRLVAQYDRLLVLRSMTKFYGMPGLRSGFIAGNAEALAAIREHLPVWSVNCIAEAATIAAITDKAFALTTRKYIENERNFLINSLTDIGGFRIISGEANYLFADIRQSGVSSDVWQKRLIREGILIRNCNSYPCLGNGFLRFAVRSRCENELFIASVIKTAGQIREGI